MSIGDRNMSDRAAACLGYGVWGFGFRVPGLRDWGVRFLGFKLHTHTVERHTNLIVKQLMQIETKDFTVYSVGS